MSRIVFNPTLGQLEQIQDDALNYYSIASGETVCIPASTEYILTEDLELIGEIEIIGTLTLLDLAAMRTLSTARVTVATYAISAVDEVVFYDTDIENSAATLPAGVTGKTIKIINTGTSLNNLTVDANGSEKLLGETTVFTLRDGESLNLTYDATEGWY